MCHGRITRLAIYDRQIKCRFTFEFEWVALWWEGKNGLVKGDSKLKQGDVVEGLGEVESGFRIVFIRMGIGWDGRLRK